MPVGELIEVILYVRNMAEAVAFYRDQLGLRVVEPFCNDYTDVHWVVLETGTCKLCLHGGSQRKSRPEAPKVVFHVNDIQHARSELLAKGVTLGEVRTPTSGVFVCDGHDPDGNPFSIESRTE